MILVDTSVWIDHLRAPVPALAWLLEEDKVFTHPWVQGELALGTLRDRSGFLELLGHLLQVETVSEDEVMKLIDQRRLHGRDIGWVDAQLLAACVARPCRLWTGDKRLAAVAQELGVCWEPLVFA